ncbi:DUF6829 domain-containing protein [Candidatus Berkiella aquae]|uniref:Uncharacterized protein n=1 Tax=Candidatus Berkiella aquae TaxID=295108 RepID=A0A0Q9YWL7_9GAMM|nr:hypothetical protein [Candidatus Berkiella aquae]MCS5710916.1 hypothetical protein [Candidatus Berkiella aquae]
MALDGIRQYSAADFPSVELTQTQIEQLSWSIRGIVSPEKAFESDPAHMEVKRCLARLFCEQQLHSLEGYPAFTNNQPTTDEYSPALTQEQYQKLSERFQALDDIARSVLRVSTMVSSVPLSPKARERADAVLGKDNYTLDSVEFLADTFRNIQHARAIYPVVEELFQAHPEHEHARITKLLQAAFPSRQHYRHMMYTEGNQTMFDALRERVQNGSIDKESFDFWRCHWTINITGFRGHVDPHGSLYLTSNVFEAMMALETTLERLFTEENVTSQVLLNDYLDKRWQDFLKMGDLPDREITISEKRLLAHIGAMMRLYHPDEGQALLEGYRFIPKTLMKELSQAYFNIPANNEPTPTFAPALYENGIDFRKKMLKKEDGILRQVEERFFGNNLKKKADSLVRLVAIADVVVGVLPLNLAALKEYRNLRNQDKIAATQPLSFMALANKNEVMEILGESPIFKRFNILTHTHISIDEKGSVALAPKLKAKDRFKAPKPIIHRYQLRSNTMIEQEVEPEVEPQQRMPLRRGIKV